MGTSSPTQSVTLSNTGSASLTISSVTVGGTNPADFAQTNTCGSGVAAGGNCTINVTFKPTATGSRSASLYISDDASGSPQTLALSGTGVQPATPPGAYSVTVQATMGNLSHTLSIPVTVQ